MKSLVEWQKIDERSGLVFPWFTHPFLEVLSKMELQDKYILEFGAGRSTAWWRKNAKWVDTVEANNEWAYLAAAECSSLQLYNGRVHFEQIADGMNLAEQYFGLVPAERAYDIIVVDGIYRTECMQWALRRFGRQAPSQKGPYILIADNWQQDYVWISPKAEEIMRPYQINRYEQPGHINHEGRPWNTSYWVIPTSGQKESENKTRA